MAHIEIKRAGIVFTPVASGNLQIKNGLPIDATLQIVSDVAGNDSVLKISTEDVTNNGGGGIMSNTAFGDNALIDNTAGGSNTSIGQATLRGNTTGGSNTAIGHESLRFNITGNNNTALGRNGLFDLSSGSNNTSVGHNTGLGITTGSNNTILGAGVTGLGATLANNIIIADGQGNRRINVDNVGNVGIGTTAPNAYANLTTLTMNGTNGSVLDFEVGSTLFGEIFAESNSLKVDATGASGTLKLLTNTVERMRITSAGNVGIGTSAPLLKLDVRGTSYLTSTGADGNLVDAIVFGNSAFPNTQSNRIRTTTSAAASQNGISLEAGNGTIGSYVNNQLLLTGDGFVRLGSTTGGIQFNGDTAAANALDDYEEGTWTIGVSFDGASVGVTTSANSGTYTKIGRQVTVNGILSLTSKGSSTGIVEITGLPFTIGAGAPNFGSPTLWLNNITFLNQYVGRGIPSTNLFRIEEFSNLGILSNITNADFANNSEVLVSFTYFV